MVSTFFSIAGLFLLIIVVLVLLALRSLLGFNQGRGIGPKRPSGAVQIGPLPRNGKPVGLSDAHARAGRVCPYELCRAPNDTAAHFCRRCGRELATEPTHTRRVAG